MNMGADTIFFPLEGEWRTPQRYQGSRQTETLFNSVYYFPAV